MDKECFREAIEQLRKDNMHWTPPSKDQINSINNPFRHLTRQQLLNQLNESILESVEVNEAWNADSVKKNADIGSDRGYGITLKPQNNPKKYKHMLMMRTSAGKVKVQFDFGKNPEDIFVGTPQEVADHINAVLGLTESLEEKLKPSDGLGSWIKDFMKSDAPQFKDKSDKEKRDMAIAAFVEAGGKLNESDLQEKVSFDEIRNKGIKLGDWLGQSYFYYDKAIYMLKDGKVTHSGGLDMFRKRMNATLIKALEPKLSEIEKGLVKESSELEISENVQTIAVALTKAGIPFKDNPKSKGSLVVDKEDKDKVMKLLGSQYKLGKGWEYSLVFEESSHELSESLAKRTAKFKAGVPLWFPVIMRGLPKYPEQPVAGWKTELKTGSGMPGYMTYLLHNDGLGTWTVFADADYTGMRPRISPRGALGSFKSPEEAMKFVEKTVLTEGKVDESLFTIASALKKIGIPFRDAVDKGVLVVSKEFKDRILKMFKVTPELGRGWEALLVFEGNEISQGEDIMEDTVGKTYSRKTMCEYNDDVFAKVTSEGKYLGRDKKFGRHFYEYKGQLWIHGDSGKFITNNGSVDVPMNKRMIKVLVKEQYTWDAEKGEYIRTDGEEDPMIADVIIHRGGMMGSPVAPKYANTEQGSALRSIGESTRDSAMVRELFLFIENDGNTYRQRVKPIIQNLGRKMKNGSYDPELAVKGFLYAVEHGIKEYIKQFGDLGKVSKEDKVEIARQLLDSYMDEIEDAAGII